MSGRSLVKLCNTLRTKSFQSHNVIIQSARCSMDIDMQAILVALGFWHVLKQQPSAVAYAADWVEWVIRVANCRETAESSVAVVLHDRCLRQLARGQQAVDKG